MKIHRSIETGLGTPSAEPHPLHAAVRPPPPHRRVLLVDLNRFTSFPTLAVGILAASLRAGGFSVKVICPLALDVPSAAREKQETLWDHIHRRIRLSDYHAVRKLRDAVRWPREWIAQRPRDVVLREMEKAFADGVDAILLSAYLEHFHTVEGIGRLAAKHGVPVLLGGPMFNLRGVADEWKNLPGVSAVVGGEVERQLPELVESICSGKPLERFVGITFPDGRKTPAAPPLRRLDVMLQ